MLNFPLTVKLTSTDNGAHLDPVLDPAPQITVPPQGEVKWTLTTDNNGFSTDDIATFGSTDNTKFGLEALPSLPPGVHVRVDGSTPTEFTVTFVDNTTGASQEIHYFVNFVFQNQNYQSPDPVIVVTPEPVGPGSGVLEHAQA